MTKEQERLRRREQLRRAHERGEAKPDAIKRLLRQAQAENAMYAEARAYYRLVAEAERLGVVTSLDDPQSPITVAALQAMVDERRAA
jgi:hypothetical protein